MYFICRLLVICDFGLAREILLSDLKVLPRQLDFAYVLNSVRTHGLPDGAKNGLFTRLIDAFLA